ncbi:MAG: helix-turn-helix domain-containing protein [Clostridia bacterium]|nr:helix-turn-helix domain-containing protein [Clostridia bacterium]
MKTTLNISERLSELMNERGISNKELAEILGVAQNSVARWKRGARYMRLPQFIAIADYFNCSLDFLAGRSETVIDFIPKERPPFYEHLKNILANKNITKYRVITETKIKSSHFVDWKNGSEPQIHSLIELADYLDISIDYLTGRDR